MKRLYNAMRDLCLLALLPALLSAFVSCTPEAEIRVSGNKSLQFAAEGGTQNVEFTSVREWTASVSDLVKDWIQVSPAAGEGGESCRLVVTVAPNHTFYGRSCSLTLQSDDVEQTIQVSQSPMTSGMADSFRGISFNEGVELMALIWRLTGTKEYNQCQVTAIDESIDAWFSSMKDHEAVRIAQECRYQYGTGYDAVAAFGLHLVISEDGTIRFNTDYTGEIDIYGRWPSAQCEKMLVALNDFYRESNLHEWFLSTTSLQSKSIANLTRTIDLDYSWYDKFFGPSDKLSTRIVLSFLAGRNNYGLSLELADGGTLLSPVISVWGSDGTFDQYSRISVSEVVVHEFCHPFCNPLIDKYWNSMATKAKAVFEQVRSTMEQQAYPDPEIMMYETLVRASSIRYLATHFGNEYRESLFQYHESLGFLLVRTVEGALQTREQFHGQYPTLDDFMPTLVNAINAYKN